MGDGGEPRERAVDELAGGATTGVGDEADAAGIALEGPIVEEGLRCQGLCLPVVGELSRLSRRCVSQLVRRGGCEAG
jgi:hypothetical protein